MAENDHYLEVKVYTKGIYPKKAQDIVDQGVSGVISSGPIADNAKKIFDQNNVWYRENVEPSDLESENKEKEQSE